MTKLEQAFTDALLSQLSQAEALTGVAEPRLAEQAQKLGGPAAVRNLLSRGQQTRQFAPLKAQGRLDLSPEALVVQGKYAELFTDDEANACLALLLEAGMY
jgi:hypothetical protein